MYKEKYIEWYNMGVKIELEFCNKLKTLCEKQYFSTNDSRLKNKIYKKVTKENLNEQIYKLYDSHTAPF